MKYILIVAASGLFSTNSFADDSWTAVKCKRTDRTGSATRTVEIASLKPNPDEPEFKTGQITMLGVPLDLSVNTETGALTMTVSSEEQKQHVGGFNQLIYVTENLKDAFKTIIIGCELVK